MFTKCFPHFYRVSKLKRFLLLHYVVGMRAVKDGSWGTWSPLWLCGQGLDGATVGIIGIVQHMVNHY